MSGEIEGARYAIYHAPADDTALGRFGRYWFDGDGPPDLPGFTREQLVEAQASARHYGFHATIRAPFTPAPGCGEAELRAALNAFAASQSPLTLAPLRPAALGAYLTLQPGEPAPALVDMAAACLRAFEPLRAPLDEADMARRRQSRLTPRQDELMQQWGYPYVMEEFRFHMTLAGPLKHDERDCLLNALGAACAELVATPFVLDRLSLCYQPGRSAPFAVVATAEFGGRDRHRGVTE